MSLPTLPFCQVFCDQQQKAGVRASGLLGGYQSSEMLNWKELGHLSLPHCIHFQSNARQLALVIALTHDGLKIEANICLLSPTTAACSFLRELIVDICSSTSPAGVGTSWMSLSSASFSCVPKQALICHPRVPEESWSIRVTDCPQGGSGKSPFRFLHHLFCSAELLPGLPFQLR